MTGSDAIAAPVIRAGCPITPQNDLLEYIAAHPSVAGDAFLRAKIAASNMVTLGAFAKASRNRSTHHCEVSDKSDAQREVLRCLATSGV